VESSPLSVERKGEVTVVTLTRPELLNRFDLPMHDAFQEMLEQLRGDDSSRAVVLASTGKAFSAGGDFQMMRDAQADPKLADELIAGARNLLTTLIDIDQPIVVAMQGPAIGLGATVALACDAIVASRDVQIADTHVVAGLVAGDGGCLVWPEAVGMLRARRHLLTGDPLTAEQAHAMGLITDLVETPEEVLPAAMALAERIAALPPLAVQGTKRALNRLTKDRAEEVLSTSLEAELVTLGSEDLLEALDAFKEKRPGAFKGR
jgi:enoyl-CoA hydratase/carnithine racemase